MKVLAADGYLLCRGLVRTLTLLRENVCVVAANSIDEVLARVPELPDLDLVLLDTGMPGMEDLAGLRRIVEELPKIPVVVTSPNEGHAEIVAAIRSGARGYFSVSTKTCVLDHALRLIMSGEYYIPACALRLGHGHSMLASEGIAPRMRTAGDNLTLRQREIIVMLAEGKSNKEIARDLKLLEGTVKLHVKGILRNLGVRNRTEAVVAAARGGYLPKGALGMDVTVAARTAAVVEGKMFGAHAPLARPQLAARDVSPGSATRASRSGRARDRQSEDWTAAKEASTGQSAATKDQSS